MKELEKNLKQGLAAGSAKSLSHAKVVGIPCDVSEPKDVRKLAKFATSELGSIDIWVLII